MDEDKVKKGLLQTEKEKGKDNKTNEQMRKVRGRWGVEGEELCTCFRMITGWSEAVVFH